MPRVYSQSQQRFVETTDVPAGGVPTEIPTGMQTQPSGVPSGTQPGGIDLRSIFSSLFRAAPGTALKQATKFKGALDILQPEGTAAEQKLLAKKTEAGVFSSEMDRLLKDWNKMTVVDRLPLPGISRVSPRRAKYETTRDLFNYMLITMVADKRITDAERKYFIKQFPPLIASKDVAKVKIDMIKNFVNVFSDVTPSATIETSQGPMSIDDLWQ